MTVAHPSLARAHGLPQNQARSAQLSDNVPRLLMAVDTEEEFDWSKPFDRNSVSVKHMADVPRLQAIFENLAIKPIYIVDYPIAATDSSADYFRGLAAADRADIGMQLHPWVTPPFEEVISATNSYGCNLPAELEICKLRCLHELIVARLGVKPIVFKSGRYGIAHDTLHHLRTLGLLIDTSAIPGYNLTSDGGPDFSRYTNNVQWFDTPAGAVLEIPTTGGFVGGLRALGPHLTPWLHTPLGKWLKLEPALSRLNLLSRIRLSPEGYSLAELKQLTRALRARGDTVFSFSLHSPSAGIGYTPYVRNQADRDRLFGIIRDYVSWFRNDFGGVTSTPSAIFDEASATV